MSLKRKAAGKAAELSTDAKKTKSITSFFGPPLTKPKAEAAFDKAVWVSKLTPEQKDLLKLEIDTLHDSWLPHLQEVFLSAGFLALKRFLKNELASGKTVYPPMKDVYSWSRHTPLPTVKAVILGQDPYHGPNQAHGLCFSVRPPTPAPPSLANIYKELKSEYPEFQSPPNKGGLLTPWAENGVLMINACLTVIRGQANSHSGKGWEQLTQKVIDTVAKARTQGVVFFAWGKSAEQRVKDVNKGKHLILKSVHPSPLSAHRGWFGCGHFRKCNEWLVERYDKDAAIDWNLNVDPKVADPELAEDADIQITDADLEELVKMTDEDLEEVAYVKKAAPQDIEEVVGVEKTVDSRVGEVIDLNKTAGSGSADTEAGETEEVKKAAGVDVADIENVERTK